MSEDTINPYVGLRPFETDEDLLFFGRDVQVLELLKRLHSNPLVAVVGGSGSGKSSLIRAGLIPALKGGYLLEDSSKWKICMMKPGQGPMYNFAETILKLINTETNGEQIHSFLKQIKKEGVSAIIKKLSPLKEGQRLNFFLLVDQFEELFRYQLEVDAVDNINESIDFVNIILKLTEQTEFPFYIVLTMRSDFIGDCVQFHGLPEALNKSQYLVPRLNRQEMKRVIEGPSKLYGKKFSPALTSKLLNDTNSVKDELPLLQHALMRIWDFEVKKDQSGELDLEDYRAIGGIKKALSIHADEALESMNDEEVELAKVIFKALTTVDEKGRKIRRPALLSELKDITKTSTEKILDILDYFIRDKRSFIYIQPVGDSDDQVIDISHESLIRRWDTLGKWVEEEAESASYYLQLAEATRLHKANKKDYLSGSELTLALDWRDKFKPTAEWASRYKSRFEDGMFETSMEYLSKSASISNYKQAEAKLNRNVSKLRNFIFLLIAIIFVTTSLDQEKIVNVQSSVKLSEDERNELLKEGILAISVNDALYKYFQTNNSKERIEYIKEYLKDDGSQSSVNSFLENSIQSSSTKAKVKETLNSILSDSSDGKTGNFDHPLSNKVEPFIQVLQLKNSDNFFNITSLQKENTKTGHPLDKYNDPLRNDKIDPNSPVFFVSEGNVKNIYPDLEPLQNDFFERSGIKLVSQTEFEQFKNNKDDYHLIHLHLVPDAYDKLKSRDDRSWAIKFVTNFEFIESKFSSNPKFVEPINTISILLVHVLGYFVLVFLAVPIYRKLTFSPDGPSVLEKIKQNAVSSTSKIIFSIIFYLVVLWVLKLLVDLDILWLFLLGIIVILFATIRVYPKYRKAVKIRVIQGVLFKLFGASLILVFLFDNVVGGSSWDYDNIPIIFTLFLPLFMGVIFIIIGYKKVFISEQEKILLYSDQPSVFYYSSNEANQPKRHPLGEWIAYRHRGFDQKLLAKVFGVFGPFVSLSRLTDSNYKFVNDKDVEFSETTNNLLDAIKQSEFFIVQIEDGHPDSLFTVVKKVLNVINPNQLLLYFSNKIDDEQLEIALKNLIEEIPENLSIKMPQSIGSDRIIAFDKKGVPFTCGRITKSKSWLEKIMPSLASFRDLALSQRSMKNNLRPLFDSRKEVSFKGKYFSDYAIKLAGFYPLGYGLPAGIMICRNLWLAKKRGKAIVGVFAPLIVLLASFGMLFVLAFYQEDNYFLLYILVIVFISPLITQWIWHKLSGKKLRKQLVLGSSLQPWWKNTIIIGSFFLLFFIPYISLLLEESAAMDNYYAYEYTISGVEEAKNGSIEDAIALFKKAQELDPSIDLNPVTDELESDPEETAIKIYANAINGKGYNLARDGLIVEATEQFKQALELDPSIDLNPVTDELESDPENTAKKIYANIIKGKAIYDKGYNLARDGSIDEAIVQFKQAIDIDPSINLNPNSYERVSDPELATNQIYANSIYEKGYDLASDGSIIEAIVQFKKAIELDPSIFGYENDLELVAKQINDRAKIDKALFEAEKLAQTGDFINADKAYQEAMENYPELKTDPWFWYKRAWNYIIGGNGEKALEFSELSIELSGEDVPIYYWEIRGIAKALSNDFNGAITDLLKVNESETEDESNIMRNERIKSLQNGMNPFTPELLKTWSEY